MLRLNFAVLERADKSNKVDTLRRSQSVPAVPVALVIWKLYVAPAFHFEELADRRPGLFPGLKVDPLFNSNAPTVPAPDNDPFNVTAPALPLTIMVAPAATVEELLAIDPPVTMSRVPVVTVVAPV